MMEIVVFLKALVSQDNIKNIISNLIVLAIGYGLIKPIILSETKRMIGEAMKANNALTLANTAYNISTLSEKILRSKKTNPKDVEMLTQLLAPYRSGGGNGFAEATSEKALHKFKNEKHPEEGEEHE